MPGSYWKKPFSPQKIGKKIKLDVSMFPEREDPKRPQSHSNESKLKYLLYFCQIELCILNYAVNIDKNYSILKSNKPCVINENNVFSLSIFRR